MEMPAADTPVNSPPRHPDTEQLPASHHPVLPPRKLGDRPVSLASR